VLVPPPVPAAPAKAVATKGRMKPKAKPAATGSSGADPFGALK
jgi:hypothetical protein